MKIINRDRDISLVIFLMLYIIHNFARIKFRNHLEILKRPETC